MRQISRLSVIAVSIALLKFIVNVILAEVREIEISP